MIIGIMIVDMFSKDIHSLKEKRTIVASIKEKLRHKFNISIIESDYQDLWQKIQISIALLSNSKSIIEKSFDQMEDFIFSNYPVQVLNIEKEYF